MNNKDRKIFWDTLCSLQGIDINHEAEILRKTIKMPKYLYRFRPVTINSLESLRTNTMFFSTADYYDDPFDSYSYIDWDYVTKQIKDAYEDTAKLEIMANSIQGVFGIPADKMVTAIKSMSSEKWIENTTFIMEEARKEIQRRQLSICFTEQCNNEVLWLKYASNHNGFALEYQITDDFLTLPDTTTPFHYFLYPIFYSNKKYDASEYAKNIAYQVIAMYSNPVLNSFILNNLPILNWHYERIGLIKHKCHEHDKEWRILYPFIMPSYEIQKQRPKMERKPNSVIIGIRTGTSEKNLITSLAKEAGISHAYQLCIDKNGKFIKHKIY